MNNQIQPMTAFEIANSLDYHLIRMGELPMQEIDRSQLNFIRSALEPYLDSNNTANTEAEPSQLQGLQNVINDGLIFFTNRVPRFSVALAIAEVGFIFASALTAIKCLSLDSPLTPNNLLDKTSSEILSFAATLATRDLVGNCYGILKPIQNTISENEQDKVLHGVVSLLTSASFSVDMALMTLTDVTPPKIHR